MLFSSTGVQPTFTVPLTLPLTRCGAPGGNKTTLSFEEGTKLLTNRQNAFLRFYLQVDSGGRFHRNRPGSGSSSRWGSRSSMHSGSTAAGTCNRKEQCQSSCCQSFKCVLWFLLLSIIRLAAISKLLGRFYYHFILFGHVLLLARKEEKNTTSLSPVPLQFFFFFRSVPSKDINLQLQQCSATSDMRLM